MTSANMPKGIISWVSADVSYTGFDADVNTMRCHSSSVRVILIKLS
jgi:hypothetical protein